jgi:putative component of toxin-antitoxin plasmid stabilization module
MKRIIATFYQSEAGAEPVKEWLRVMAKADRQIVGADIGEVEFGWPIGVPVCRSLRDGVLEVRSTIKDGKVEARTYFAIEKNIMLLLYGEEGKDGQKDAIDLAVKRLKDHRARRRKDKKRK